jgi:spermidine/putrescine transport system permease protein
VADTTAQAAPTTTAMRELDPDARPRAVRKPRGILVPLWLGYVFLYLPILIVVAMSFNDSENLFVWRGFSLRWYPELFGDRQIM